jgi:putative transposase
MYKDPLLPNNIYHIYNRGNNKETIFKESKNYNHFLYLWKKHVNPIADSLVYSLQPNHFHFLVRTKEVNEDDDKQSKKIQQSFANFFNAYSKSINNAYNRTGSLLQERFGRKMISSDDYFTQIIWYIHYNSQKHGIVTDFRDYPYCSY